MIDDAKPDVIIHLAAKVGGIGANREKPGEFFYDNLMMGVQLIHHAWQQGVSKFVAIGTICAYPKYTPSRSKKKICGTATRRNQRALRVGEENAAGAVAVLPRAIWLQFDLPAAGEPLRSGRQFQPRQFPRDPALIRKCLEAKEQNASEIVAWGDGSPTREFIYVDDTAEGITLATMRYNSSDPVNIGSNFEISIKELTELIARLTGFEGEIRWDTGKPNGQPRRKLDTSRAKERFGFEAKTNFEAGLRRTIEWYANERAHGRG